MSPSTPSPLIRNLCWASGFSLVISGLITLSHLIPFNIPALLLFLPVTLMFPQLAQSGTAVTYGFAWLEIHALWVWGVLILWHWLLVLPPVWLVITLIHRRRRRRS